MNGKDARDVRSRRKLEHVERALRQRPQAGGSGFADVELVHNCLPELALDEVSLEVEALGHRLGAPIYINAMTGGAAGAEEINRQLARAAAELGLAMAVGSQRAGLDDPALERTYRVVREVNPNGVVFANVSANVTADEALRAVEMVGAAALQVHLNVVQELLMAEGDRDFRGLLANIGAIVERVRVPVIAKEVGFGIARSEGRRLRGVGVSALDVGGRGGTNFALIEAERAGRELSAELSGWGIQTAASLVEVREISGLEIFASGGIRGAGDVAKAIALGAVAVGVARPALEAVSAGGYERLIGAMTAWLDELRGICCLQGCGRLSDLRHRPVVITGKTREWLTVRGRDLEFLARRGV